MAKENRKLRLRKGRVALLGAGTCLLLVTGACIWDFFHPVRFRSHFPKAELGESYDPKSNILLVFGGDPADVQVSGQVNTLLPGEYPLVYTFKNHSYTVTVQVADTKGPVLNVHDVVADINEEVDADSFVESCKDASKTSVTITNRDALVNEAGSRFVELLAIDEFGNKTIARATLTRKDQALDPKILNEQTIRYLPADQPFVPLDIEIERENGYNYNVSNNASTMDLSVPGRYTITYTVTDQDGRMSSFEETVIMEAPVDPYQETDSTEEIPDAVPDTPAENTEDQVPDGQQ